MSDMNSETQKTATLLHRDTINRLKQGDSELGTAIAYMIALSYLLSYARYIANSTKH